MPSLIIFPRGSRMDAATTTGHRSGRVTRWPELARRDFGFGQLLR